MTNNMSDKSLFFTSRAFFSSIGISLIFSISKTNYWLSMLIGVVISIIVLYFVKNDNVKIFKKIVGFLLSATSMILLINMGHTLYLNNTPILVLSILPVAAVFVLTKSEKNSFIKVANIFFIYSMILFGLKLIGLIPHLNMDNFLPHNTSSIKDILCGGLVYALISTTPTIYLNDVSDKKTTIRTYLISSVTTILVSLLAIGVLGYKEVLLYRNPEYIVLKRIGFLDFINDVDSFFNFAILLDLLFTSALGLRVMEIKNGKKLIFTCITLLILTCTISKNNYILMYIYYNLPYIFFVLLILHIFSNKLRYIFKNNL